MPEEDLHVFHDWSKLTKLQQSLVFATVCLTVILVFLIGFTVFLLIRTDIRLLKCNRFQRRSVQIQKGHSRKAEYQDIVNDTATTIEKEFAKIKKFIVSIHYKLPNGEDVTYCVGSILNQKYFMTSSICIHKTLIKENMYVRAGSIYYNKGGTIHKVAKIPRIPDWRTNNTYYYTYRYFAIIKVDKDFPVGETVSKVHLPRQEKDRLVPNYKLYTAGWGTSMSMKLKPKYEILRPMAAQLYDAFVACRNYLQRDEISALQIIENILCAGDLKATSKDQCNIDAGAPLTHLGIIVGVSWSGMSCKNYPTVYTKVSLYSTWASNIINNY